MIKSRYVARLVRFVIFSAAAKRLKNALSEIAIGDGGAASARSTLLPQSLADQQSWVSHHENVERALGYWLTERYLTEEYIENAPPISRQTDGAWSTTVRPSEPPQRCCSLSAERDR